MYGFLGLIQAPYEAPAYNVGLPKDRSGFTPPRGEQPELRARIAQSVQQSSAAQASRAAQNFLRGYFSSLTWEYPIGSPSCCNSTICSRATSGRTLALEPAPSPRPPASFASARRA
eukprot:72100-Prorocentrum_minimum.AAC.3